MIIGIGIDLVEIARIEQSICRFGRRFLDRVLTPGEFVLMPSSGQNAYVAARFAAKEAALKALGTGMSMGISLLHVEIENMSSGQPRLILHDKAGELAFALGVANTHVSLTHSRATAGAVVILES
jgi:holo-[acyl-carrier protein] synthase